MNKKKAKEIFTDAWKEYFRPITKRWPILVRKRKKIAGWAMIFAAVEIILGAMAAGIGNNTYLFRDLMIMNLLLAIPVLLIVCIIYGVTLIMEGD